MAKRRETAEEGATGSASAQVGLPPVSVCSREGDRATLKTARRREITEEELAKHSTEEDCWIVIHDLVFDVTGFLGEHPGGGDVMLPYAGKDCTQEFEDIAHSDASRDQCNKLLVGYLAGAPEEAATKMMPTKAEAGGGGGGGMIPAIILVLIAVIGYFVMNMGKQ